MPAMVAVFPPGSVYSFENKVSGTSGVPKSNLSAPAPLTSNPPNIGTCPFGDSTEGASTSSGASLSSVGPNSGADSSCGACG